MCIFFFNWCLYRYRNTITKYQSLLINLFLIDASVTGRYTNEFFVSLNRMTTANTVLFLISHGKKVLNINNFIFRLSKPMNTKNIKSERKWEVIIVCEVTFEGVGARECKGGSLWMHLNERGFISLIVHSYSHPYPTLTLTYTLIHPLC
jgi:hypothetical protein